MQKVSDGFNSLVNQTEHLLAICITDRDGVLLVKALRPSVPERFLEPQFTASFLLASEQMSKLDLGKNKSIVSIYAQCEIVQFNYGLILTLISQPGFEMVNKMLTIGMMYQSVVEQVQEAIQ